MGHEQLNTTQIYTHVSNQGMQDAIDNINNDDTIPDDTKDFRIKTIETLIEKNIVISPENK